MALLTLTINKQSYKVDVDPETPLLWVIRDEVNMTGTKFGCGIAQCGACTVHLNGAPVRFPFQRLRGRKSQPLKACRLTVRTCCNRHG